MERLFTIGAYGYDAESFFDALEQAGIDLFLDVRRRRGIRGPEYTFGNAARLTKELAARGIDYRHLIELAPKEETRAFQKQQDAAQHVSGRQRTELSEGFIASYRERTLEPFNWQSLVEDLRDVRRPVLFCVERSPDVCHRGLVAGRLTELTGVPVTHLTP